MQSFPAPAIVVRNVSGCMSCYCKLTPGIRLSHLVQSRSLHQLSCTCKTTKIYLYQLPGVLPNLPVCQGRNIYILTYSGCHT